MMLENVSKHLRFGGMFIGTIPDSELLLYAVIRCTGAVLACSTPVFHSTRLSELPTRDDGQPYSFGNSKYRITFEGPKEKQPTFGHRYSFYLQDAVDDVPEYVVQWAPFKRCVSRCQVILRRELIK